MIFLREPATTVTSSDLLLRTFSPKSIYVFGWKEKEWKTKFEWMFLLSIGEESCCWYSLVVAWSLIERGLWMNHFGGGGVRWNFLTSLCVGMRRIYEIIKHMAVIANLFPRRIFPRSTRSFSFIFTFLFVLLSATFKGHLESNKNTTWLSSQYMIFYILFVCLSCVFVSLEVQLCARN